MIPPKGWYPEQPKTAGEVEALFEKLRLMVPPIRQYVSGARGAYSLALVRVLLFVCVLGGFKEAAAYLGFVVSIPHIATPLVPSIRCNDDGDGDRRTARRWTWRALRRWRPRSAGHIDNIYMRICVCVWGGERFTYIHYICVCVWGNGGRPISKSKAACTCRRMDMI